VKSGDLGTRFVSAKAHAFLRRGRGGPVAGLIGWQLARPQARRRPVYGIDTAVSIRHNLKLSAAKRLYDCNYLASFEGVSFD